MKEGKTKATILVTEDDQGHRQALERILIKEGYTVLLAGDGRMALDLLRKRPVELLLADLKMPGMSGLELLRATKAIMPDVEVIMITGYGTVEEAVFAMKEGSYDFLTKPVQRASLLRTIDQALERQALIRMHRALEQHMEELQSRAGIIGMSPAIQRTLDLVTQIAPSSATVLIMGESGTGKEVIATAIHQGSPRRDRPFVKVNCATLPETLLESELFGYERGAFTGALRAKPGRFELAHRGTLFLDEIGDLTLATQAKLLRVLQEGEFERLGGTKTVKVDVRIIAATNQDLGQAIGEKRFREDLYYRLNVIIIALPPLRERREDIPLLAQYFLRRYAERNHKTVTRLSQEALGRLMDYAWPGNVRELEHAIERAVVFTRHQVIDLEDLPEAVAGGLPGQSVITIPLGMPLEEVERQVIAETLQYTKGDKGLAARLLGIASRTIYRKLDSHRPSRLVEMADADEEPFDNLSRESPPR